MILTLYKIVQIWVHYIDKIVLINMKLIDLGQKGRGR